MFKIIYVLITIIFTSLVFYTNVVIEQSKSWNKNCDKGHDEVNCCVSHQTLQPNLLPATTKLVFNVSLHFNFVFSI